MCVCVCMYVCASMYLVGSPTGAVHAAGILTPVHVTPTSESHVV